MLTFRQRNILSAIIKEYINTAVPVGSKEWLRNGHFTPNVQKFNQELRPWIIEYNFVRPHQTLGYLTPIEWAIKYKQLSQMYSSSTNS